MALTNPFTNSSAPVRYVLDPITGFRTAQSRPQVYAMDPYMRGAQEAAQKQYDAEALSRQSWGKSWQPPNEVNQQTIQQALIAWGEGLTPVGFQNQERVGQTNMFRPGQQEYGAQAALWLQQNAPDVYQTALNEMRTNNRKSFNQSLLTIAAIVGGGYLAGSAMAGQGATMAGVGAPAGAGATGTTAAGATAAGTGAAAGTAGAGSTAGAGTTSAVAGGGATTPAGGVLGSSMPSAMQAGVAVPTGGSGAMGVGSTAATTAGAGGSFDFLDGIFGEGATSATGSMLGDLWKSGGRELALTGLSAWQSNQASKDYLEAAKYAADRADPFYAQRPQYQAMLKGLMTDPNSIQETPSYRFRFDQGQNALERSLSAKGYLGSGNLMHDLQNYGQGMASQEYENQFGRLSQLSGAGFGPGSAGSIYQQGANQSIAQNQQTWGNLGTVGRVVGDMATNNTSPMFSNYR